MMFCPKCRGYSMGFEFYELRRVFFWVWRKKACRCRVCGAATSRPCIV